QAQPAKDQISSTHKLVHSTAVNYRFRPVDRSLPVQPAQQLAMQTLPHPRALPVSQSAVRGRRRAAELSRQMPPGNTSEQHEHDRVEADTIIDTRTTTTRIRNVLGKQRPYRLPQL